MFFYCHFTEEDVIIRSETIATNQDNLLPGYELTAWTPPLSATVELFQEASTTTVTSIPVDLTSQSAGAIVPESTEDHQETRGGIPSESALLVIMDTEISTESKEVAVDDIAWDTMEVATEVADAVTHKQFGGNTGADKTVPDTTEKETIHTVERDDKGDEILPEDPTDSEVMQGVTPRGEEPPSEVVAQEVLTEATVAVLTKPTIIPTIETVTVEEFGQVSPEPGPEAPSEVEEITDNSLDVTPKVTLTDDSLETPTEDSPKLIIEILPEAPDLGEAEIPEEPKGDIQNTPVEQPTEDVLEVSHDETKVSTEAPPTVFLVTDPEEDKLFIHVTPDQGSVLETETDIPSQASTLTTTDKIEAESSEHSGKDKAPEDKPALLTEVTSEPVLVILQDRKSQEVTPKSTAVEVEPTEKKMPEETVKEEEAVEEIGKSEEVVKVEIKHEEATVMSKDKATEAGVKAESSDVVTAKEELTVQTEDVTSAQEVMVETTKEKMPGKAEGATVAVEDTVDAPADVTTDTSEEPVEPVKTVDEITKEKEGGTNKVTEPIKGREEALHIPVEPIEKGKGVIETTVEEPAVETVQEPEPVEKTEDIEDITEPTEEPGQEVETVKETMTAKEDITEKTKPTREPAQELVEEIVKETEHTEEPAQEPDHVEDIVAETKPTAEPAQDVEFVEQKEPTEDPEFFQGRKPTGGNAQGTEAEVVPDEDKIKLDITTVDKTEEAAGGEPSEDSDEATSELFEEITEEEPGGEGTKPEVTEDIVIETFDRTPSESDEEITPVVVVVPEDTEGLFPGTEVEATLEPVIMVKLPEESELELPSDTTKESSTQVDQPSDEVTETARFPGIEGEITPEVLSETSQEVVTHTHPGMISEVDTPEEVTPEFPEEFSLEVALEKDSTTSEDSAQFTPAKVVPEVAPEEDHTPGKDSAQFAPAEVPSEEVEHISQDVTLENAGEIIKSPVEVSPEPPEEITPEVTAESTQGTTIEEVTPGTSLEVTTKYIVEYNNGNFPDLTEKPYGVDDNLLGNNGFGLEDEKETLVSK